VGCRARAQPFVVGSDMAVERVWQLSRVPYHTILYGPLTTSTSSCLDAELIRGQRAPVAAVTTWHISCLPTVLDRTIDGSRPVRPLRTMFRSSWNEPRGRSSQTAELWSKQIKQYVWTLNSTVPRRRSKPENSSRKRWRHSHSVSVRVLGQAVFMQHCVPYWPPPPYQSHTQNCRQNCRQPGR
jgi:hypothetical protein